MRKLLIGLMCMAQLALASEPAPNLLTPSPVSAAITVGTWVLSSDRKKVFEIDVQAKAATFEQAKKEGFRLAVEHAVGNFILSETEVSNSRMKRDEIITYASGFVDRFEILSRSDEGNGVRVSMRVWVAHSSIAQRLLNKSEDANNVEGSRVQAKVSTYQEYRSNADRVLGAVLNDYPRRAFDVYLANSQVVLDTQRQPHLVVDFVLQWNEKFLVAMTETVQRINPKPDCDSWVRNCSARSTIVVKTNIVGKDPQAWFDDDITWNLMLQRMVVSRPVYQLVIRDQQGREQARDCFAAPEIDTSRNYSTDFVQAGAGKVVINGLEARKRIRVTHRLAGNIGTMGQIEISVVPIKQCQIY